MFKLGRIILLTFLSWMPMSQAINNMTFSYSPPQYPSPWMSDQGEWADAYEKAAAFVKQMSLLEKVNLTTGVGFAGGRCLGNTGDVSGQNFTGLCLLDIPIFFATFADWGTAFPGGHNTGATWDRRLAYARGQAMGAEYKAKGADVFLRPAISPLGRFPEGGRNWEGFGADPYLAGELVAETVTGIQENGIVATTKHYLVNEQEHFRKVSEAVDAGFNITESLSTNLDDKTMHEVYLWPFANAVKAGTGAIMSSYNQVNNSYSSANSYTINHLLKGELGFQGFVMTDWGAQHAGVESALAGTDMAMPGDSVEVSGNAYWGSNLTLAILNGTVPQWRIDDMCMRIMGAYYKVGRDLDRNPVNIHSWNASQYGAIHQFAPTSPISKINEDIYVRANHASLVREIGAASNVLLKNNKALPLDGSERHIALFGADAGSNPYGVNGCQDRACNNGTLAQGWGSGSWQFPYLVTPEQAVATYNSYHTNSSVSTVTNEWATSQILNLASQADVCLVFGNANSGEGYQVVDTNYGDRNNLTLWNSGDTLINKVASLCSNTIVVLHTVGPVLMANWYNNANVTGIIWAGLPGQESGNSLLDVLYGAHNPSGKLPFTIGATREDYGPQKVVYKPENKGPGAAAQQDISGLDLDYRYFDIHNITPVYEFGYGLSYTTYNYTNLKVAQLPAASKPYVPSNGTLPLAPTFGSPSLRLANDNSTADTLILSDFTYPNDIPRYQSYIYPYLSTNESAALASKDRDYGLPPSAYLPEGSFDISPRPPLIPPSGGAPGGNPSLWEEVYTITVTVTNTGSVDGYEVVQLYVNFVDETDQPPRLLRGFERVWLPKGQSQDVEMTLLRRDVSVWDVAGQDWRECERFEVHVGASSRKLYLQTSIVKPNT